MPPDGYLARSARASATQHDVLLILDEVQSGPRAHRAHGSRIEHEGIRPDGADPRQGAGRRRAIRCRPSSPTRDLMQRVHARLARLHLRRQRARGRGRRSKRSTSSRDEGLVERSAELGAYLLERLRAHAQQRRHATCAGAACGSASRSTRQPPRRAPCASDLLRARACCPRTRTARCCASRRRSPSRARNSTGGWSASSACSLGASTDPSGSERCRPRRTPPIPSRPRSLPALLRHGRAALCRHLHLHAAAPPRSGRGPGEIDIGLLGIPFDGATTNRPGARHGPRAVREASALMRLVNDGPSLRPTISAPAPTLATCRSTPSTSPIRSGASRPCGGSRGERRDAARRLAATTSSSTRSCARSGAGGRSG